LNPQKPKECGIRPYGPDLAPSDFFLCRYQKEKLGEASFTASDDLILEIRQIFSDIPEIVLKNVFPNCITRLF
jgi:hypothetical protein